MATLPQTSGSYTIKYTRVANAPYQQNLSAGTTGIITYYSDGTFSLDGGTRTKPINVLQTTQSAFSKGQKIMAIDDGGGGLLIIADPTFDLSNWAINLPSITPITSVTFYPKGTSPANYNSFSATTAGSYWDGKCFLSGTMIDTPRGPVAIENLKVGEKIYAIDNYGNKIIREISGIGKGNCYNWIPFYNKEVCPVRIKKDSISLGVPNKDLLVTSEHCLFLDGFFIPARMLVNDISIFYDTSYNNYEFYHIYIEQHSIIVSNNTPSESYLVSNEYSFDKYIGYPLTRNKTWEKDAAAPLNTEREFVENIYYRILDRALEWIVSDDNISDDNISDDITYLMDEYGNKFSPKRIVNNKYIFNVNTSSKTLSICSDYFVPSRSIGPFVDDRRKLGLLIGNINIFHSNGYEIYEKHLICNDMLGWFPDGNDRYCWTDGHGILENVLSNTTCTNVISIEVLSSSKDFPPTSVKEKKEVLKMLL